MTDAPNDRSCSSDDLSSSFGRVLSPDPSWGKAELRSAIRRARRAGTELDSSTQCRILARFLAPVISGGGRVVIYDAMGDEVDLAPLVASVQHGDEVFAITRTPDEGFDLTVHPLGVAMESSAMGYRQPRLDAPRINLTDIGAVLVPALAFDPAGARLGRGAGYYDRLLARLEPGVALVGMTAGLIVEAIPVEDHDVSMTHLAGLHSVLPVVEPAA